ncbi:Sm-like protein, partial [Spraguea lophii 42_110]
FIYNPYCIYLIYILHIKLIYIIQYNIIYIYIIYLLLYFTTHMYKYLLSLKNNIVEIETKDNKRIRGIIHKVNKKMNITLKDAEYINHNKSKINKIIIKGTALRYIVIEEYTDKELRLLNKCNNDNNECKDNDDNKNDNDKNDNDGCKV